jgi:hypothetical protein
MSTLSLSDILGYAQLGILIFSVVGAYFFLKFKLKEAHHAILELKDDKDKQKSWIERSLDKQRSEIERRYDEKIMEIKMHQDKLEGEIKEELKEIRRTLTQLTEKLLK